MLTHGSRVFRFGVFELDGGSGELRRHGLKIRLPDQSFQILRVLLSRPGDVVTREELRQVLWTPDTFVDFEVGLNSAIRKLREALDDSADNPRFIETLPRRGYRFVASVSVVALEPPLLPASAGETPETSPLESSTAPMLPSTVGEEVTRPRLRLWHAAGLMTAALIAAGGIAYQQGGWVGLSTAAKPIRSLVVLPFENLTGDPGQDSFVVNVTDTVTNHLAGVVGLDVISRTSARLYKHSATPAPAIPQALKVEGVVSATVVRSGAGVGITVHLIRAETGRELWTRRYDAELSHIMDVQQRIASDIAVAVGRPAPPPGGRATTQAVTPVAYEAYLKGLTAQGQQQYEGHRRAAGYFEEAVSIQPDFAEAHAALALVQLQFLFGGPLSPREAIPRAEAAARRALELDDTQSRAHWALGQILVLYHWRFEEGDKELDRAAGLLGAGPIELSAALTASLRRRGRLQEAIAVAERARKLDPLSLGAQVVVGTAYRAAGQYDRAINELRQALEMSPGRPRVHLQLGVTFVAMGRFAEAIGELEIAARPAPTHNARIEAYLGYAYAAAGRTGDARAVLTELEMHRREQYVSSFGVALIHDALGEKELAVAALRRAHQDHAVEFGLIDQYPPFRAIASEPGFQAVMRQVGLER